MRFRVDGEARSSPTGPGSTAKRTKAYLFFPAAATASSRNFSATGLASSPTERLSSTAKTTNKSFDGLSQVNPQRAATSSTTTTARAASEVTRCHFEKSVSPR